MKNDIFKDSNNNTIIVGSSVKFYDCRKAMEDKDHSGTKDKYFPIGKVIKLYEYKSMFGYTDKVCDIEIGDRISKAHFVRAVKVVKN